MQLQLPSCMGVNSGSWIINSHQLRSVIFFYASTLQVQTVTHATAYTPTHTPTLVRKLDLHIYKKTCTWLRVIRSPPDFAHDEHIILTIVSYPHVRQQNLFRELLFLVGKSRARAYSNRDRWPPHLESSPTKLRLGPVTLGSWSCVGRLACCRDLRVRAGYRDCAAQVGM
jgi:hypothetical protein